MSRGFGSESYQTPCIDVLSLQSDLDDLSSGRLAAESSGRRTLASTRSLSSEVQCNPLSYDEYEEARRPIMAAGQHSLISNYGTAWTKFHSAGYPTQGGASVRKPEPAPMPVVCRPSSVAPGVEEYEVKEGETLSGVALHLDTTSRELKRLNRLSSDSLYTGQRLRIPLQRVVYAEETAAGSPEAASTDGVLVDVIDKKTGYRKQVWRAKKSSDTKSGSKTETVPAPPHLRTYHAS